MSFIEVPKQMLAKVWEAITAAQSTADTAQTSANDKLPLAGGALTGPITTETVDFVIQVTKQGDCMVGKTTNPKTGSSIGFGIDSSGYNRGIYDYGLDKWMLYYDQNNVLRGDAKILVRSVDGTHAGTDGNVSLNALKTTGGTMTGDITFTGNFAHIWKDNADSGMVICGAPSEEKGARFVAMGENRGNDTNGMFECIACTSTTGPVALYGYTDKRLTWAGKNIVRSVNNVDADSAGNVYTNGPINSVGNYPNGNWRTVDLTSLNQDTWYPVVYYQSSCPDLHIKAREMGWSSAGKPSWSTHSTGGFSAYLEAHSYGSGWDMWPGNQYITARLFSFCNLPPIPGVGQLTNTSRSYIWLRGGAIYALWCNQWTAANVNDYPVIITTSSTWENQTIAPTTTCPGGTASYNISVSSGNTGAYTRPAVLTDTSVSGTSWFRVYGDGLIVQGGRLTAQSGTVTLPKAFTTTNYTVVASEISTSNGGSYCYETRTRNYTTTSFGYYVNSASGTWIAMGY